MAEKTKNIYQKLMEVRKSVPYLKKESQGHQYNYTGSSQVLAAVREKMDEMGLLLITKVVEAGYEKDGKAVFTEMKLEFTWVNVDNPDEQITIPFYAQGVDQGGEKGVGKSLTYGEKYFLLKQFNIATDKDDPDAFQERAKNYKAPAKISKEDQEKLKNMVNELAQLKGADTIKIYTHLKIENVSELSEKEGREIRHKLHTWIAGAKKEKQEA